MQSTEQAHQQRSTRIAAGLGTVTIFVALVFSSSKANTRNIGNDELP